MSQRSSTALSINNLSYSYKSDWTSKRFSALKDLSLTVYEGETFGFLGHNGAGKTTTIKCILDLIRPTTGSIEIFGVPHCDPEARRSVGYLPEQPYFYDHLTVYEIMKMYGRLAGVPHRELKSAISDALELVKVAGRAKSSMKSLSKGLTQRVAMAQAIMAKPKLLILDEPFSGLDPIGRREFKDLLFLLKENGTTIFVSSHILEDIEFLCDRVSIMAHGELKQMLSIDQLAEHSTVTYELVVSGSDARLGQISNGATDVNRQGDVVRFTFEQQTAARSALSRAIMDELDVHSYRVRQGTLEDLFVQLVQFEEAGG